MTTWTDKLWGIVRAREGLLEPRMKVEDGGEREHDKFSWFAIGLSIQMRRCWLILEYRNL
jgi:hypothetical protein